MNISSTTAAPIIAKLSGEGDPQSAEAALSVNMLKKVQDQMKQQGDAMVSMIEQAGAPAAGNQFHLDAYA